MHKPVLGAVFDLLITVLFSTLGYRILIGSSVSFFDCFYMTIPIRPTVGYAERIDLSGNNPARLLTIFIPLNRIRLQ